MKRLLLLSLLTLALGCSATPKAAEPRLAPPVNQARAALSQTSGTIRLAGLNKPVTVLRDPWGIPHIYAETQDDLFFAQGFVAAQDRMFQLDLWRRAGEGKLAEILGPQAVERDRIARLLRYRGDMEAEYASYAPDAKSILEAFTRGINAYLETHRDRLPIEFELAGFRPEPWTPEVCLTRIASLGVSGNADTEALRAVLVRELGTAAVEEVLATDPPRRLEVPEGLDLEGIGENLISGLAAAGSGVRFERRDGSNNWVVDGALSATGKPLLANDPHRAITIPSLRWMVHLVGPGWNVIGAGEPALPGVAAGHNERVGFGFTIVDIDQQDLYAEEIHPEDPKLYRSRGRWVPFRIERERIAVKGAEPVEVELKFTEHGPVILEQPERRRAWALRWVGSEPGTAGYLGSLSLNRARNWPEFLEALERWKVPAENLVYADVEGNIGWQAAGLAPVRDGWSGLLPVPGGEGLYEWRGFLPLSELPREENPPRHFLATANHNIQPPGYRHELGYEPAAPFRFQRIVELLSQPGRKFTVADFERLQHDEVSLPARDLTALLRQIPAPAPDLQPWIQRLTAWDGTLSRDSAEAAVYEIWLSKLPEEVFKPRLPAELWKAAGGAFSTNRVLPVVKNPTPRWFGDDPRAGRDAALLAALRAALATARERLGEDPAKWRWGALHTTAFRHPLASTREDLAALFDLPSFERGGDGTTVNASAGANFTVSFGASFREILDLSDWDRSVATSVPGQSGQPLSPHYGDLLPLWAEGRYFPLLFSRERIEKESRERLVLEPALSREEGNP